MVWVRSRPFFWSIVTERSCRCAARGAELGNQLRRLLTTKADWEKAIAKFSEQITPETTDAALISGRAKAYIGTEQWDLARRDWLRAVKLCPPARENRLS